MYYTKSQSMRKPSFFFFSIVRCFWYCLIQRYQNHILWCLQLSPLQWPWQRTVSFCPLRRSCGIPGPTQSGRASWHTSPHQWEQTTKCEPVETSGNIQLHVYNSHYLSTISTQFWGKFKFSKKIIDLKIISDNVNLEFQIEHFVRMNSMYYKYYW